MDSMVKINEWALTVQQMETVQWDKLPDIDLYMDQVLTYMDRQLALFQRNEESKLLTSSMINNYVKDGIIPRPEKKKYSKEHLALMMVVCMLKQVLPIQNIAGLFEGMPHTQQLFDQYTQSQDRALKEVCDRVLHAEKTPEAMRQLTLELAVEANARRIAAESILALLAEPKKKEKSEKPERHKKAE